MREVQATEIEARLTTLLDEVERGETIVITRDGKPIARIVPETTSRQVDTAHALAEIEEFRKTMPRIPLKDILSGRHEGHKY